VRYAFEHGASAGCVGHCSAFVYSSSRNRLEPASQSMGPDFGRAMTILQSPGLARLHDLALALAAGRKCLHR
jgi:hypothetical protein